VRFEPVSRPRDATTQGDLPSSPDVHLDGVEGIFWVSPEERFDELRAGSTLGRAEDCSIRLSGPGVSRQHGRIDREGPLWVLRDLESKNGSFVNAQQRDAAPLSPQDTVRVGDWVGVVCRLPKLSSANLASVELFTRVTADLVLSQPTRQGLSALASLASADISLVIEGETGTGKEVLARAIHQLSGRSGPLVAINCAAIPPALAEAELFGYKKGAFTGAVESARGHVASAQGGTLFLDEIVDLSLSVQSKLLRVLEERAVTPIGASRPVDVDFRLVASCQERLERRVATGEFRADLYARLNGAELWLPPLRARRQEVFHLLRHVMGRQSGAGSVSDNRGVADSRWVFDSRLIERLCSYAWPYNVRELCQLGKLFLASGQARFALGDLPGRFLDAPPARHTPPGPGADARSPSRREAWLSRHSAELDRLKQALHACSGNLSEAARKAGIPRYRARRLLAAEAGVARR
jgi:DNA-binding NtrC family response regulator